VLRKALSDAGLPVPDDVIDARYLMRTDDWYVLTRQGWFWWDSRTRKWMPTTTGVP
jgi:hypothetical protein